MVEAIFHSSPHQSENFRAAFIHVHAHVFTSVWDCPPCTLNTPCPQLHYPFNVTMCFILTIPNSISLWICPCHCVKGTASHEGINAISSSWHTRCFCSPTSVSHAPLFVSLKGRFANARYRLVRQIRAMISDTHAHTLHPLLIYACSIERTTCSY